MADETNQKETAAPAPIIVIKRITAGHHGHHGGAWKIAYADFVTAMMAFFLLLWLLNAVPAEKLTGIAEYFEPTVGVFGNQGIGFKGGNAKSDSGESQFDKSQGVKYGVLSKGNIVSTPQTGTDVADEEMENERFALVEGELKKVVMADAEMQNMQDNITFEVTPSGLNIKVMDQDQYPMFMQGGEELSSFGKNILSKIVNLVKYSPNFISISGHTTYGDAPISKQYSDWELSTERANTARRHMIEQGLSKDQIASIVGRADTDPLDPDNPKSSRNRRIEITLLRNSIMPFNKLSQPRNTTGTQ
jgi:chemotaxis protein MotB